MHQTPAAILVLASSILAYAATVRAYDPVGVILGMTAFALGAWGVISLGREAGLGYPAGPFRLDPFGPARYDFPEVRMARPVDTSSEPTRGSVEPADLQLSPEIKARLSMMSHLEGRDRSQILDEALRAYLPRYGRSRAA